ncbi:MAG: response regulator [Proteobacteria bacterium]|nr:response regulator [Pseudomonadota bacterium]
MNTIQKKEFQLLIVDDDSLNIDILVEALQDDYRLGIAKNGQKALEFAQKNQPDLILLDIMMPGMDGYEVCTHLKTSSLTEEIAVIFLSARQEIASKTKGFEIGAVDYITKPFNTTEIKARVKTHLSLNKMRKELNNQNLILKDRVEEKTAQIQNILQSTIQIMAQMAETRDPYTAGHQQRVSLLASTIAKKMALSEENIETIRIAGILHDIGKIRIPVDILNRPGKILAVEYEIIKIHAQVGFDLLSNIPFSQPIAQIVHQHHEKLDGSGYPQNLTADQILPESKIMGVADVMEAMSSHRPYRPALGNEIALTTILKNTGTHFDPEAAEACRSLFEEDGFSF